jgi:hypothetical protein
VETQEQHDRLFSINCDELQGYYFSAPMPANAVESYIDSCRPRYEEAPSAGTREDDGSSDVHRLRAALGSPLNTIVATPVDPVEALRAE